MDYSSDEYSQYTQTFQPQQSNQQPQQPQQSNQQLSQTANQNKNANQKQNSFVQSLYAFLNYKTGSILAFSVGICIGGSFKDLIQNIVTNVVKPLIIKLLIITKIYDISVVSSIITEEHSILSITSALSSLISFLVVFITVFFIFNLTNNVIAN